MPPPPIKLSFTIRKREAVDDLERASKKSRPSEVALALPQTDMDVFRKELVRISRLFPDDVVERMHVIHEKVKESSTRAKALDGELKVTANALRAACDDETREKIAAAYDELHAKAAMVKAEVKSFREQGFDLFREVDTAWCAIADSFLFKMIPDTLERFSRFYDEFDMAPPAHLADINASMARGAMAIFRILNEMEGVSPPLPPKTKLGKVGDLFWFHTTFSQKKRDKMSTGMKNSLDSYQCNNSTTAELARKLVTIKRNCDHPCLSGPNAFLITRPTKF